MEEVKEKKEIKAKDVSLIVKIFAVVFIVAMATLKWCNIFNNCEIKEICLIGGVIGAIFGDISLNTTLDKFTKRNE